MQQFITKLILNRFLYWLYNRKNLKNNNLSKNIFVQFCKTFGTLEIVRKSDNCHKLGRYSVFHRFRQAKFAYGGSISSSIQFSLLPQRPQNLMLDVKISINNFKIIISLPWSKSVKQTVTGSMSNIQWVSGI